MCVCVCVCVCVRVRVRVFDNLSICNRVSARDLITLRPHGAVRYTPGNEARVYLDRDGRSHGFHSQ